MKSYPLSGVPAVAPATVPLARLLVVIAAAAGLPFGAVVGLLTWNVALGAGMGLLFGCFLSAALVGLHLASGGRCPSGVLAVRQSAAFLLPGDQDAAQRAAEAAVAQAFFAPPSVHRQGSVTVLEVRTPMSWRSFGERVRIELAPARGDGVLVRVGSRPTIRTTLVDYGKNRMNVEAVRAGMERAEAPRAAGA